MFRVRMSSRKINVEWYGTANIQAASVLILDNVVSTFEVWSAMLVAIYRNLKRSLTSLTNA